MILLTANTPASGSNGSRKLAAEDPLVTGPAATVHPPLPPVPDSHTGVNTQLRSSQSIKPLLSLSKPSAQLVSPPASHCAPDSSSITNPSQPKSAQSVPSTSSLSIPSEHSPASGSVKFSQPVSCLHSGFAQFGSPSMKSHVGIGGNGVTSSVLGIPSSIPILMKHPCTGGQLSTTSFASYIANCPNVVGGSAIGDGLYTPGVPAKGAPLLLPQSLSGVSFSHSEVPQRPRSAIDISTKSAPMFVPTWSNSLNSFPAGQLISSWR